MKIIEAKVTMETKIRQTQVGWHLTSQPKCKDSIHGIQKHSQLIHVYNTLSYTNKVRFHACDCPDLVLKLTLYKIMNQEPKKVTAWLTANKLSLNINKTNFIIFKSNR